MKENEVIFNFIRKGYVPIYNAECNSIDIMKYSVVSYNLDEFLELSDEPEDDKEDVAINSKALGIIKFVGETNFYDLGFIYGFLDSFVNGTDFNYVNRFTQDEEFCDELRRVCRAPFSKREKSLSREERIEYARKILDTFSFKCYCSLEEDEYCDEDVCKCLLGYDSSEAVRLLMSLAKDNGKVFNSPIRDLIIGKKQLAKK